MKNSKIATFVAMFAAYAAMAVLFYVIIAVWPQHKEVVIDCRIAEISPDIPVKAKEECRKLNVQRK